MPYIIYQNRQMLDSSIKMDMVRWESTHGYYVSQEAQCKWLEYFVEKRIDFLDSYFAGENLYHKVVFCDYDGNICDTLYIKDGDCIENAPTLSCYEALFAGWINSKTREKLDIKQPIFEDTYYKSNWIDASLIVQNGCAQAEVDIKDVDLEQLRIFVDAVEELQKGEYK